MRPCVGRCLRSWILSLCVLFSLWVSTSAAAEDALVDLSRAITYVAKKNIPAVVHIEVTQRQEVVNPFFPFENDPFFRFFFDVPRMPRKFKRELKGLGTGMIMDPQGHILTNHHVVAGATEIQVLMSDGRRFPATLVGSDPKTDLAVLKVDVKEALPHVTFGDSDKVEVGEWVVAIGHPRGLDQTVTQGIISAKHRRGIMDPSNYQDFLQTDAAINPGNSGGPLLNLKGEVIGVNAAIVSQSGGFEGIGFAIPSNMALHIAKALIAHGKVERGWIGVSVQDLTPEMARSFGLKTPRGALVADVVRGGPADRAGMKRGDVVVRYRGKEVLDASTLRNFVAISPIGEEVEVKIVREGKEKTLRLRIGSLQEALQRKVTSLRDRLGAQVRPVTPKEAREYGLESPQGVFITWIDRSGPLGEVGFEVGDLILEINGKTIGGLEDLVDVVSNLRPHQRVVLLALDHRTGRTGYVQVVVR